MYNYFNSNVDIFHNQGEGLKTFFLSHKICQKTDFKINIIVITLYKLLSIELHETSITLNYCLLISNGLVKVSIVQEYFSGLINRKGFFKNLLVLLCNIFTRFHDNIRWTIGLSRSSLISKDYCEEINKHIE